MSDFTLNDTMARIRYELDDREIYNDIRSKTKAMTVETVIDADETYAWQYFTTYWNIPAGWDYFFTFVQRHDSATNWEIVDHEAWYWDANNNRLPYYDYTIGELNPLYGLDKDSQNIVLKQYVTVVNTGSYTMRIKVRVRYKYLASRQMSHEEIETAELSVRSTDSTSIAKYGRRVMNLVWNEGTPPDEMQKLCDFYLSRYKDPYHRLSAQLIGSTDALRTQIITRDISDTITVVCTDLGLNEDHFINAISWSDDHSGIPIATWGLEAQRAYETYTLFTLDVSSLDGAHVLAP